MVGERQRRIVTAGARNRSISRQLGIKEVLLAELDLHCRHLVLGRQVHDLSLQAEGHLYFIALGDFGWDRAGPCDDGQGQDCQGEKSQKRLLFRL